MKVIGKAKEIKDDNKSIAGEPRRRHALATGPVMPKLHLLESPVPVTVADGESVTSKLLGEERNGTMIQGSGVLWRDSCSACSGTSYP
jgi:hypothetical protein